MLPATRWFRTSWRAISLAIAMLGFVALYLLALWKAPSLLVNQDLWHDPNTRPEHRLSAEHNARLIVVSLGGAFVVLLGLLYTARNYRLAHRGQVTERFTKALERLGSEEMYIRIGGIYALEHVIRDSPEHHGDVVEVLAAFARDRTRSRFKRDENGKVRDLEDDPENDLEPASDVAAALNALAHQPDRQTPQREGVDLHGLPLGSASLRGAQLRDVNLWGAYLLGVDLAEARLDGAILGEAHLEYADLTGACLRSASLRGAQLRHARMVDTNLRGADLQYADLLGAHLEGAHLEGADLSNAQIGVDQLLAAFIDADTALPDQIRQALEGARSEDTTEAKQA